MNNTKTINKIIQLQMITNKPLFKTKEDFKNFTSLGISISKLGFNFLKSQVESKV